MKLRPFLWLLLVCFALIAGCAAHRPGPESLPRPAIAYMHWMQKESMRKQAPELIAEVSQSGRVWLQGSQPGRSDVLLRAAPNWLYLDACNSPPATFSHLAEAIAAGEFSAFEGLYLGDTGEKPDLLHARGSGDPLQPSASLRFDPALGADGDFENLAAVADETGMQLGSTLLPGATGQGSDFLLQARNVAAHGGLYAMLPLPAEIDANNADGEWDCRIVPIDRLDILNGIAAATLARDQWPWASPGGWAVTGPVLGADGQPRRWIYRYSENVFRPVLAWQDPSGQAERILAAAVIRQTGLLRQTLTGLSFEPLIGLEPAETGQNSFSPGLDAINDLSRQIHRYGGWAIQIDPVPLSLIGQILAGPCDFCRDDLTGLLAAYGLMAADGRPVASLYRKWIDSGLDISRLARGLNGDRLLPRLLKDNKNWSEIAASLDNSTEGTWAQLAASQQKNISRSDLTRFELVWRTGMPGLVFMPLQREEEKSAWLENTLRARKSANLAAGKVLSVTRGRGGGFGLLSALPTGGYWLLACNFGVNADQLEIRPPKNVTQASDAGTGENLRKYITDGNLRLPLDGRAARNVLLE